MTEAVVEQSEGKDYHAAAVVTVRGRPIFLKEDWNSGIGGGLWSTGLALAKYFETPHAQNQLQSTGFRTVLELGSGNGFLAVCLLAAAAPSSIERMAVTDTREHLALIQSTIDINKASVESAGANVQVMEYLWGSGPVQVDREDEKISQSKFDLIIGSDLAYRDSLHDPLIDTFLEASHSKTTILLGVTMNDTKPIFFSKLTARGLHYEKLADHCVDPSFRGVHYGIFIIQKLN